MRRNKFVLKQGPQDSALDTFSHRYPSHQARIPRESVENLLAGAPATWLSPRLQGGLLFFLSRLSLSFCALKTSLATLAEKTPPPWDHHEGPWSPVQQRCIYMLLSHYTEIGTISESKYWLPQ